MTDKPSITGSSRIDKMMNFLEPTPLVDVNPDETKPPEDPDIWESRSREIRTTRHQVFALLLVKRNKELCMIPYSAIDSGEGTFNGNKFTFRFFRGEAAYEASIEGPIAFLQRVVDYLSGGKAEKIQANGDEITVVTWEAVKEPEE